MACAMERHQRKDGVHVIPIMLRRVELAVAPFIGLKALPEKDKPVTSWSSPNDAWANVATGIRKVVDNIHQIDLVSQLPFIPPLGDLSPRLRSSFSDQAMPQGLATDPLAETSFRDANDAWVGIGPHYAKRSPEKFFQSMITTINNSILTDDKLESERKRI